MSSTPENKPTATGKMAKPPLVLKKSGTTIEKEARLKAIQAFAEQAEAPHLDDPKPWLSANPKEIQSFMMRLPGPDKAKIDYAVKLSPNGTSKHSFILAAAVAAAEQLIMAAEEKKRIVSEHQASVLGQQSTRRD